MSDWENGSTCRRHSAQTPVALALEITKRRKRIIQAKKMQTTRCFQRTGPGQEGRLWPGRRFSRTPLHLASGNRRPLVLYIVVLYYRYILRVRGLLFFCTKGNEREYRGGGGARGAEGSQHAPNFQKTTLEGGGDEEVVSSSRRAGRDERGGRGR